MSHDGCPGWKLWKERDGQVGAGPGGWWGWEVEGQAGGHEPEGQERVQIVLWAIAFPYRHLNSGSIWITLHTREEHPRVGSADQLRGGTDWIQAQVSRTQSRSFSLTPDLPGARGGVISCERLLNSRRQRSTVCLPRLATPGLEGGVWCSLCLGCKILLGVSECV